MHTYSYTSNGQNRQFGAFIGSLSDADTFDTNRLITLVEGDKDAIYARFDETCGENTDCTGDWTSLLVSPANHTAFYYNIDGEWIQLECDVRSVEEAFTCYFDEYFDAQD